MAKITHSVKSKPSSSVKPSKKKKTEPFETEIHYALQKSGSAAHTYAECDEDGDLVDHRGGEGKSGSFYLKRTCVEKAPERIVVTVQAYDE